MPFSTRRNKYLVLKYRLYTVYVKYTGGVNLTRDGGRARAVVEYRELAEHLPRLDGAQLLPSFSNLHQPLCREHTQTKPTTLSL